MSRGRAWVGVAAGLAGTALLGCAARGDATAWLDWQPALATTQPWRAFSAVAVHYSAMHLAANLAGAAVVGLLGGIARLPRAAAFAWLAAWPATQLGLLLRPELLHFGGLSGVLHAGVAIVATWLVATGTTRAQRAVGLAIGAGLLVKVLGETPWGPALRRVPGWDIAIAPFAHLSGAVAGVLCAAIALRVAQMLRMRPTSAVVE